MTKVIGIGSSAALRTRGLVLPVNDFDSRTGSQVKTTFETHLGWFHVLADGTVLLRLNQDALAHSSTPPFEDETHVELSDEQAAEVARVLLKLSYAAEQRRKLLDGRAGFAFTSEFGRWWAAHDGEAMALRSLKTRAPKPSPTQRLDFDTKTSTPIPYDRASRRKCAACKEVLSGTIYVCDKSVRPRMKLRTFSGFPMWSGCEFCVSCVEAPKRTGLTVVAAPESPQ